MTLFRYDNIYNDGNQLLVTKYDGNSKYQNMKYLDFPTSSSFKSNWPSKFKLVSNI